MVRPLPVAPSPNAQAYVSGSASGSLEPAPEKLTASGAVPLCGVPPATATGGLLPGTGLTVSERRLKLSVSSVSNTAPSESALSRRT